MILEISTQYSGALTWDIKRFRLGEYHHSRRSTKSWSIRLMAGLLELSPYGARKVRQREDAGLRRLKHWEPLS
jgi:hypothetical protein